MIRFPAVLLVLSLWLLGCNAAPPATAPSEATATTVTSPTSLSPTSTVAAPTPETAIASPDSNTTIVTAEPTSGGLPESCIPKSDAEWSYIGLDGGYCLLYPEGFRVADTGQTILEGPPLDEGPAPVMATLRIEHMTAEGDTLSAATDSLLALLGAAEMPLERSPTTLGSEAAELVEGIPGQTRGRHLFTLHEGMIYHLSFEPDAEGFPQAAADIERLWQSVTASFSFLSPEVAALYANCPTTTERTVGYVNALDDYCLLYPGLPLRVMAAVPSIHMTTFAKPEFFSSPGSSITIQVAGPAEGRNVEEVVAAVVAEYSDLSITTTPFTLGGEPALMVEGMPGRMSNRQGYVVHEDWLYTIIVMPYNDPAFTDAQAEAEAMWEIVTGSFTFIR
ncbi:MAG: hypothetical protein H0T73_17415 [Ardenticatenales bacterium]|nr:hypothetical protein [Ardenticatenales bacterium]